MQPRIRRALLKYQRKWVYDESTIKLCEKSRRIGITWATAGEAVYAAGVREREGGMNVWYMVNNADDAREFIDDCASWARVIGAACGEVKQKLINDSDEDGGNKGNILAFEIRFTSGFKIRALSSRPRRLRGKQGWAILDEAAHHDDLPGFLKAAKAFTMQGGRIAIISTHNGEQSEFNKLIVEERKRRSEGKRQRISLHRYTLDDALADGYYEEIVCRRNRMAVKSDEAKAEWRERVIDEQGDDADEELFAIPQGLGSKVLCTKSLLDRTRWMGKVPSLFRVVVSVDPSGEDEGKGDDAGVIGLGMTPDEHIYITHDRTTPEGPAIWAQDSVNLYNDTSASILVAEKNYGAKMVRDLVRLVDNSAHIEYKDVVSKSSKYKRAKPVFEYWKRGKIHLCGHFPELEQELTTWREGMASPNRLDALVQGCTELLWPEDDSAGRDDIIFM